MDSKYLLEFIQLKGVEVLYRNNSTSNLTRYHIIDDSTQKTYCRWSDFTAQNVVFGDERYLRSDFCKKCLKKYINESK